MIVGAVSSFVGGAGPTGPALTAKARDVEERLHTAWKLRAPKGLTMG